MVEGHGCHRVAAAHRKKLLNLVFAASSPNGRFADGARAIDAKALLDVQVHGKNLFYFFGKARSSPLDFTDVVHIHFGMSGQFRVAAAASEPATKSTTRLRLESSCGTWVAHLSAMTVRHGGEKLYTDAIAKLGPDPLRADAQPELLFARMRKSRKSVGLALMDQSMVAGIGNIYRAEILFKAGVHPEQKCSSIAQPKADEIWRHSVALLQRGFVTGSILTVDDADAAAMGPPWTRRYVYNHSSCGRCGSDIKSWAMANRTAYACEVCQPLLQLEAEAGAAAVS